MTAIREHLILFDFDGVIANIRPAIFAYLKRYNPLLTNEELLYLFEGNIYKTSRHLNYGADEEVWMYYRENLLHAAPFQGIVPAIEDLEARYSLIMTSSGKSNIIREYLDQHGIANHFIEIMGGEVHESKIEKMNMVFTKYGITAEDCLFVTDTLGDLREAAHVHVPTIAVTWGFHSAETLRRGNPIGLVETPGLLVEAIDRHFRKG